MGIATSKFANDHRGETYVDLIKHFSGTAVSTNRGKLLLAIWSSGTVISFLIGLYQQKLRRQRRRNEKIAKEQNDEVSRPARVGLIKQLQVILKPAFKSPFSSSSIYLVLFTISLITRILLTIKIAKLTGKLGKMIGSGEFTKMFHVQVIFGLWCVPAAVVNSMLSYFTSKLSLSIRASLTKYLHERYMNNLIYYRMDNLNVRSKSMTDVDTRLTQDLKKFTSSISELYGNILKPVCELVLYSITLSRLMGFKELMGFFAFFLLAGRWLQWVMPPFAAITAESQHLEGDFRSHHTRVISHAEEIAFYGGSNREKEIINEAFHKISRLSNKHYFLQLLMGMLDSYLVKYGASMVAYSTMIPAVYLGRQGLKGKSTSHIMQYYLTSTQLFIALGTACRNLVLSYKRIQALYGYSIRIWELYQGLQEREKNQDELQMKDIVSKHPLRNTQEPPKVLIGDDIKFENVDIFSPSGQLLIRNLNIQVRKNTNVLITGRNGSGKSSLFRVLGGLWPLCCGTLTKPANSALFYVPQKPYMSPGTLRDQITYPEHYPSQTLPLDAKLKEIMDLVGLGYLVEREGWNSIKEWADVLSGGEKQRVAMARLFYHRPAFGILDECTSAVSQDVEAKIYETCHDLGITIFTVSHRPQLMHHHDYVLALDGEGSYSFKALKHND